MGLAPPGAEPHFCIEDHDLTHSIGQSYFLMAGLCIENLLKGIIVHAHPEYVKEKGELGFSLKSHDLVQLAKDAGLYGELSREERDLLKMLGEAVVYWGRYHIPRDYEKLKSGWGWDDPHFVTFDRLFRRWAKKQIRLFAVSDKGVMLPGDCEVSSMTPDEYVLWRLDRKRPDAIQPPGDRVDQ